MRGGRVARIVVSYRPGDRAFETRDEGCYLRVSDNGSGSGSGGSGRGSRCRIDGRQCCVVGIDDDTLKCSVGPAHVKDNVAGLDEASN